MSDQTRLKRYTSLAAAVDMLVQQRIALLNPSKWQDTNDTHFLGAFQEQIRAKSLYAACFTQAAETFHHWRVFAGDSEGVCVEIDREGLLGSLIEGDIKYRWGDIKYRSLAQLRLRKRINAYELPFLKRLGFGDEKEFRLIYYSSRPQKGVHYVPIKRAWIKRIVLNPWIGDELFQSMKTALQSIPSCKSISIIRTSLIDNTEWKGACDKVEELPLIRQPPIRSIW